MDAASRFARGRRTCGSTNGYRVPRFRSARSASAVSPGSSVTRRESYGRILCFPPGPHTAIGPGTMVARVPSLAKIPGRPVRSSRSASEINWEPCRLTVAVLQRSGYKLVNAISRVSARRRRVGMGTDSLREAPPEHREDPPRRFARRAAGPSRSRHPGRRARGLRRRPRARPSRGARHSASCLPCENVVELVDLAIASASPSPYS